MRQGKVMRLVLLLCGTLLSPAVLCAQAPEALTVSAAISLKNAFDEIGKIFESRPGGARVQFNYGPRET